MGMKKWDHPRGTLRALVFGMGRQLVVCHSCRRFKPMVIPPGQQDRPFDPCPFRCSRCGQRAKLRDADEGPPHGYVEG